MWWCVIANKNVCRFGREKNEIIRTFTFMLYSIKTNPVRKNGRNVEEIKRQYNHNFILVMVLMFVIPIHPRHSTIQSIVRRAFYFQFWISIRTRITLFSIQSHVYFISSFLLSCLKRKTRNRKLESEQCKSRKALTAEKSLVENKTVTDN